MEARHVTMAHCVIAYRVWYAVVLIGSDSMALQWEPRRRAAGVLPVSIA